MKNKNIISIFIGLAAVFGSCKDHLDVKPKGKIIPETTEDFTTIIHYWLNQVEVGRDEIILGNAGNVVLLDFYGDDLDATLAFSLSGSTPIYAGMKINTNQKAYADLYSVIKDCNMIIGNMEDAESELAKTLLGTAWTIRSICYYNLLLRYCEPYQPASAGQIQGLPLIDRFDMENRPARLDLETTVRFIEEGIKKAISYDVTNPDFIFTADVAKAYLARFYFWVQDWGNAIALADEVLKNYPMLDAGEYKEAINQKLAKTRNVIVRSFTSEDDIGTMNHSFAQSDVKTRPVSGDLVESYAEKDGDIRYGVSFDAKRVAAKTVSAKFRSEELCLIIAESYAHQGNTAKALEYLNLLRSKRITSGYTAYTESNLPEVYKQLITVDATGQPLTKLMSAILCERRKELFLEGDRWFELKRNGRPEFWVAANGKKYVNEKYLYTYPILKTDVDLFPGLVVQNPGYIY